jgi:hypothetical protein
MAAVENFHHDMGPSGPAENAFAVTPHDTNELSNITRGLYLGVTGDVTVVMANGDEIQFLNMAAGIIHPLRVKIVKDTGTDADLGIVGVY